MAQRNRNDAPGRVHHVMNRGEARRVIFPDDAAKRRYLALTACSVRRGELFVQAFCIMDTHFHMVAGTPDGRIGYPFMRINNAYSRYFNRRYWRDGSPYRGRITTFPVLTHRYWCTLIRYTDNNPVSAGICTNPAAYPYGSAWRYTGGRRTPWMDHSALERHVCEASGVATYDPRDYARSIGPFTAGQQEVVDRRLNGSGGMRDPADQVFRMRPVRVAAWMRRKARLADGLSPWAPIAGSSDLLESVAELSAAHGEVTTRPERNRRCAWMLMRAGLLHDGGGMGIAVIGRRLGIAASTAGRRLALHKTAMRKDKVYALLAGEALRRAMDKTYPDGVPA